MLETVRINWRLWTILQAELLDPECQLPDDLRANVLSLAQFIDKHTLDIIAEPKPEKLDVLIAINRELAGGMFTTPHQDGEVDGGEAGVAPSSATRSDKTLAVSA